MMLMMRLMDLSTSDVDLDALLSATREGDKINKQAAWAHNL